MPTSRLCGGISETSRSPKRISPQSGRMKPASTIKSVVLPEPDGPSSVMNSPLAISRLTSSRALVRPYVLVTSRMEIGRAMLAALFIGANSHAAVRAALVVNWPRGYGRQASTSARSLASPLEALVLHKGVKALDHLVGVLDPPVHVEEKAL